MKRYALAASLLCVGACDEAMPPAIQVQTMNMGRLCLYSEDPTNPEQLTPNARTFSAGQVLYVEYETTCLSPGCMTDIVATCQLSQQVYMDRMLVHVQTKASWTDRTSQLPELTFCNRACYTQRALCVTQPLVAGSYALTFGQFNTLSFDIPSEHAVPPCIQAAGGFYVLLVP